MQLKYNKYNIAFLLILLSGIGFCIGGIFVPPLLAPGVVCLTAAAGMATMLCKSKYGTSNASEEVQEDHEEAQSPSIVIIDNRSINFTPHFDMIMRPPNPSMEQREAHLENSRRLTLI